LKYTANTLSNRSFEIVAKLKYFGMALTNQISINEEIKCGLNSGNVYYLSVQSLLSSTLLSKNINIKISKTITLPVLWRGCKSRSPTLRKHCRLRIFENEETRGWRKSHNKELHNL
jgi:hypothetical protein